MAKLNDLVKCDLPSQITFEMVEKTLHIILNRKCITEDMQKDCSAFEGWAMCLKCKYPELIKNVVIEWVNLDISDLNSKQSGHYYRFLYRAYKFQMNYPSWVSINPSIPQAFLDDMSHWVLNCPTQESGKSQKSNPNAEAHLERFLLPLMQNKYQVADHQLPVGLFHDFVSSKKENTRTSRGSSQIDLWSISDGNLTIYELKNDVNTKVGIISEIQFYANVMKDLTDHRINYPKEFWNKRKFYRHVKELAEYVYSENKIKKVVGVLLADNRHPLVTDSVIDLMSTNQSGIRYEYKTVKDFKEELL